MSTQELVRARILMDLASHGLRIGCLLEASPALIKELAAAGYVDPHKKAVAYAVEQGAEVLRSTVELAAEAHAARVAEAQAALAAAEAAYNAAPDAEAKAAALLGLTAAADALQALGG